MNIISKGQHHISYRVQVGEKLNIPKPDKTKIAQERANEQKKLIDLAAENGIGVGELVTKLTTQFGIPQCARCKRWAKVLDQLRIRDWKVEIVKNVREPDDNTGLTSTEKE